MYGYVSDNPISLFLGWGTGNPSGLGYPSWDRTGKETRAVRGANMIINEFGGQPNYRYGPILIPFPTGHPASETKR